MASYFKHSSDSRNKGNIMQLRLKYGMAGYGLYCCLLELLIDYGEEKCFRDYSSLANELCVEEGMVKSVIEDFGLFVLEENFFYCRKIMNEVISKNKISRSRAEAGRKGGNKKAENLANATKNVAIGSPNLANATKNVAIGSPNLANATKNVAIGSERKEKEIKKDNISPTPPIKEINKEKENVLSDRSGNSAAVKKLYTRCREFFESYTNKQYHDIYYWTAKDAGQLKRLLNAIKFARKNHQKNGLPDPLPADDDSVYSAYCTFVTNAHDNGGSWIQQNFTMSILSSKYNEIKQTLCKNGKLQSNTGWSAPKHTAQEYDEGFGS